MKKTFSDFVNESPFTSAEVEFENNVVKFIKKERIKSITFRQVTFSGNGLTFSFMCDDREVLIIGIDMDKDIITSIEKTGSGILYTTDNLPKQIKKPSQFLKFMIKV